jgi:hypothetical protein
MNSVEGSAREKNFDARNPKFETISNDQKGQKECRVTSGGEEQ